MYILAPLILSVFRIFGSDCRAKTAKTTTLPLLYDRVSQVYRFIFHVLCAIYAAQPQSKPHPRQYPSAHPLIPLHLGQFGGLCWRFSGWSWQLHTHRFVCRSSCSSGSVCRICVPWEPKRSEDPAQPISKLPSSKHPASRVHHHWA